MNKITIFLLVIICIQIITLIINGLQGIHKYFLLSELDLYNRYESVKGNPWVVITGASSGQGKEFAYEFAQRDFNLLLIGSKRTEIVKKDLEKEYPNIHIKIIYKDFRDAHKDDFFDEIQKEFDILDMNISILINNIGYRTGCNPYHEMDPKYIRDTISAKPIVQSRLTRMIIPIFMKRKNLKMKSCLLNISAQCLHPNYLLGIMSSNEISVPYLSVYEASNAFCFYQSSSIYKEYRNDFDILNITPGAVVTQNTEYLNTTLFSVSSIKFVKQVMKMIGQVKGNSCGYWGHAFSPFLINCFPFVKDRILQQVGENIATNFMNSNKVYEFK
jgi:short-subunit dehydrogenase